MTRKPLIPLSLRNSRNWYLVLPKVGIFLLVSAVLSLLWMLHHNEVEEQRSTLIGDVLWLEQNLRFHLVGNEEQLRQLASDLAHEPDNKTMFRIRANHMLKNNTELEQILWLDEKAHLKQGQPSSILAEDISESLRATTTINTFSIVSKLGKSGYSEAYFPKQGSARFQLMVPIYGENHFLGVLVGVYSVENLLRDHVPWWFAEKYQVKVSDLNGTQFGTKSNIKGIPNLTYELPLDPPGKGLQLEVVAYKLAGNPLQRILAAAIILLAAGTFWSLWGIRSQVQRRVATEQALRSEHAFRQAMEDSLTVGMRARDLKGTIIYVNPAFCQITGFSRDELVGAKPPMPYWAPEEIEETLALHRAVLTGQAPPDGFEANLMRKNGERFHALIYEAPLIDGNGQHTGWMGSVLDITERRKTEELARQQQEKLQFTSRLVTMGEMASTLAHELNQPLSAIASYNTGCLNMLASGNFNPDEIRHALEKLGVQAQRAGKIIRRVHDFVRKSEPKRAPCSVNEIIEDCLGFVEAEARKRSAHIERDIEPDLPIIQADRLMLEQVLLNLIRNGLEAMAENPPETRILKVSARLAGTAIRVSVRDHGPGIPPESQEKLFSAFYTTKPDGMGIGLSICRSIIEFHRGRLDLEPNDPDQQGAAFTFTLPVETTS